MTHATVRRFARLSIMSLRSRYRKKALLSTCCPLMSSGVVEEVQAGRLYAAVEAPLARVAKINALRRSWIDSRLQAPIERAKSAKKAVASRLRLIAAAVR